MKSPEMVRRESARSRALPDGWRWVKIGDVCESKIEKRDPRLKPHSRFEFVDIAAVCNSHKAITESKTMLGKEAPSRARQVIKANDILVATTRPNLNAVARVPDTLDGEICSTGFCILRPTERIVPDYLFAYVQHHHFVDGLTRLVRGALYPAVNDGQVRAQLIPFPPLKEQRRIAGILREQMAAVEKARKAAQERLEAVKALPAAYLRDVFPRPGQPLPEGWRRISLGDASDIVSGVTIGRKLDGRSLQIVAYLRVANVLDGQLDLDDLRSTPATGDEIKALRLSPGDLLLTEGGDPDKLGRGALWEGQVGLCIHQNHIFRVRLKSELADPEYASFLVGSAYGKQYFLTHAKQTTGIASINKRVLSAFPLALPAMHLQKSIAATCKRALATFLEALRLAKAERDTINALPAAILRQAFNGEL